MKVILRPNLFPISPALWLRNNPQCNRTIWWEDIIWAWWILSSKWWCSIKHKLQLGWWEGTAPLNKWWMIPIKILELDMVYPRTIRWIKGINNNNHIQHKLKRHSIFLEDSNCQLRLKIKTSIIQLCPLMDSSNNRHNNNNSLWLLKIQIQVSFRICHPMAKIWTSKSHNRICTVTEVISNN